MPKIKAGLCVPILITTAFCILVLGIFAAGKTTSFITDKHGYTNGAADTDALPGFYEKININTASAQELSILDGIGDTLAQRIVAYRAKHGPFRKVADIQNVAGIGSIRFAQIADYITVGG